MSIFDDPKIVSTFFLESSINISTMGTFNLKNNVMIFYTNFNPYYWMYAFYMYKDYKSFKYYGGWNNEKLHMYYLSCLRYNLFTTKVYLLLRYGLYLSLMLFPLYNFFFLFILENLSLPNDQQTFNLSTLSTLALFPSFLEAQLLYNLIDVTGTLSRASRLALSTMSPLFVDRFKVLYSFTT